MIALEKKTTTKMRKQLQQRFGGKNPAVATASLALKSAQLLVSIEEEKKWQLHAHGITRSAPREVPLGMPFRGTFERQQI